MKQTEIVSYRIFNPLKSLNTKIFFRPKFELNTFFLIRPSTCVE